MKELTLSELGGPVIPQQTQNADGSVSVWCGINLRDYFAAAALQGFCAHPHRPEGSYEQAADWAYQAADAMLAARERKDGWNG